MSKPASEPPIISCPICNLILIKMSPASPPDTYGCVACNKSWVYTPWQDDRKPDTIPLNRIASEVSLGLAVYTASRMTDAMYLVDCSSPAHRTRHKSVDSLSPTGCVWSDVPSVVAPAPVAVVAEIVV